MSEEATQWQIVFTAEAEKASGKLDKPVRRRIDAATNSYGERLDSPNGESEHYDRAHEALLGMRAVA